MKILSILISFAAAVVSTSCFITDSKLDEQWNGFKVKYNKVYSVSDDENLRKGIFKENLLEIIEHNIRFNKNLETYEMGLNEFSDMTYKEFALKYLGISGKKSNKIYTEKPLVRKLAPHEYFWNTDEVPIKHQRQCASCWAFAASATVETHYKLFYNKSFSLAEQELVDCDRKSIGCAGGWTDFALEYIKDQGISYEEFYQYKAHKEQCNVEAAWKAPVHVVDICQTPNNEQAYKDHLYQYGPIAVYFFADGKFLKYKNGVYQSEECNVDEAVVNHAVLLVGYGMENGIDYWLVRNSWGKNYGMDGYFKIKRDVKMCNLGQYPAYYPDIV